MPTPAFSSELSKRIATALVGVAILLSLIIFTHTLGVFVIALALALGMTYEFANITFSLSDRIEKRYVMLTWVWITAIGNWVLPYNEFELLLLGFFGLFFYFLFTSKRHEQAEYSLHFRELAFAVLGLVYVVMLPLYLVKLHRFPAGVHFVLLFLFIVWMNDIGAYFVGKKFGRRKLLPHVSPKKTVEGALGGLASGLLIAAIYKLAFLPGLSGVATIVIPLMVGVTAQIGDLCESFFKRSFDTKDSGSILPGHGGFLDRFDGVVFSLPVMYACIRLFALS
jgi:phosphatidate cytidylyltransferase